MGEGRGFELILNRDLIIVEIVEADTTTKSGLYVPNAEFLKGYVVAAGVGVYTPYGLVPNAYKVGDKVLLDKATLESAKVRKMPDSLYKDGLDGRIIDFEGSSYLISSDLILGKWEKKEVSETTTGE